MRATTTFNWRFDWLGWALVLAAVTVVLTAVVTYLGVPESWGDSTTGILHLLVSDVDKVWLLLVWLCSGISVLMIFVVARYSAKQAWHPALRIAFVILVGMAVLLLLRLAVERDPSILSEENLPPRYWPGFGLIRFIIGGVLALCATVIAFSRFAGGRALFWVSITVAVAVSVLPLIQTPDTGGNNAYTFDELLAPATGRMPSFDFISQYENLLGYPLALVALIAPQWFQGNPEWAAMLWISILQIATLTIAVLVVIRLAPRRLKWLAPLTIVPITLLMGQFALAYYATFPLRFFLPTVFLGAFVLLGLRARSRALPGWVTVALGTIGGLAATNNLDFGVPALFAGLATVIMASPGVRSAVKSALLYLAGALVVPLAYVAIGMASGRTFRHSYFLFFVENFGVVGAFNVAIEPFDLHNTYVFIGIVGLVVGVAGLRVATHRNRVLYMAMLFEATWLLLALPYYSGRSLVETLVSAYTLPAGIVLVLLLIAVFPRLQLMRRAGVRQWRFREWVAALTALAGLAFALATWTGFPALPGQLERVQKPVPASGDFYFTRPDPTEALERIPADTELIGLFGVSSGIWSIKLGVPNADVFLHPDYLTFTGGPATACLYAASLRGDSLLMTEAFLPYMEEDKACRAEFDFRSVTEVYSQNSDSPDPGDWILLPRH